MSSGETTSDVGRYRKADTFRSPLTCEQLNVGKCFLDEPAASFAGEVTRICELLRPAGEMLLHVKEDYVFMPVSHVTNDCVVRFDGDTLE